METIEAVLMIEIIRYTEVLKNINHVDPLLWNIVYTFSSHSNSLQKVHYT